MRIPESCGPPVRPRTSGGPPLSPIVMTTPSPCPSTLIKTSESFSGVLFHRSGCCSQQAVLCQLLRESQRRAFPAKTCLHHPVANAHTFAVKRAGARCPIPGSAEQLQYIDPEALLQALTLPSPTHPQMSLVLMSALMKIDESQSEMASGMCSAGGLTLLQRGAESSIQTE